MEFVQCPPPCSEIQGLRPPIRGGSSATLAVRRGAQPAEAFRGRQACDTGIPDACPDRLDEDWRDTSAFHRSSPAFVIVGDAADFDARFTVDGKIDQSVV